jgi:hypothetical protein
LVVDQKSSHHCDSIVSSQSDHENSNLFWCCHGGEASKYVVVVEFVLNSIDVDAIQMMGPPSDDVRIPRLLARRDLMTTRDPPSFYKQDE